METAQQTISRLLGALETLTHEEHLLLNHGFFSEATAVQAREQPLVARIVELLFEPGVAGSLDHAVQDRAQRLINAQRAQAERLEAAIDEARNQLEQIRNAQSRAQKLRPSYGALAAAPSTLSFAGEG
jgi:capsule polysaccharide export protein KpsE/RkpR